MTDDTRAKKGGPVPSLAEQLLRSHIDAQPMTRALGGKLPPLPRVSAPVLDGIEVTAAVPEPVTEAALLERFYELRLAHATRREVTGEEPLAAGDEVVVDVLAYARGGIMPFGARRGVACRLGDGALPTVEAPLIGRAVGGPYTFLSTLPEDVPDEGLRGAKVATVARVVRAERPTLPAEKDPRFLQKLGRGATLDAVFDRLAEELALENDDEAQAETERRALDEMLRKNPVAVPDALVDAELLARWREAEGRFLVENQVPEEDQQAAQAAWLTSPSLRAEAKRRLGVSLLLAALIEREGITIDAGDLEAFLTEAAQAAGTRVAELQEALAGEPASQRQLGDKLLHLSAVAHVMARIRTAP